MSSQRATEHALNSEKAAMALGRSMSSTGAVALGLVLTLCFATSGFSKTEWIVGGWKGWTFGVHGWEKNKTFYPGDVLGEYGR